MTEERLQRAPASHLLESDLKRFIKESGLVIWLDADHNYSTFVKGLSERAQSGAFPFPVVPYEGSFLELMLALETYGSGLHPEKVVVHLPGFNEQSVSETPLYELFKAGKRYRKGLDTLLEEACVGLVMAEEGRAFRETKPTLEQADAWLVDSQAGDKDLFLVGLSAHSVAAVISELFVDESKLCGDVQQGERATQFVDYFAKHTGLASQSWLAFIAVDVSGTQPSVRAEPKVLVEQLRFVVASWLMAVEFVSDLGEAPKDALLRTIALCEAGTVAQCRALVVQLREHFPADYRVFSERLGGRLKEELTSHQPEMLGSLDTFEFEETAVRQAALSAIVRGDGQVALGYASARHAQDCFWVRHDPGRATTWRLITKSAQVICAIVQHSGGVKKCASLEEAMNRYRDTLYEVDAAHRDFEQAFHQARGGELEDEARLQEARGTVRKKYRVWVDQLTAEFCKLCDDLGPLPAPGIRQREVYEQFVHPLIEGGERVAFFLVDAMRFEMAEELRDYFKSKKYGTRLAARLAELPTVTEVGMNALAPVSQLGRLRPVVKDRAFKGFRSSSSFVVSTPDTRVRAMASRSVGGEAIHLELAELTELSPEKLKGKLSTKGASNLIVVRSLELDSAGEKGFHLGTFEHTLVQIRDAVQRLQRAGICRFVLASDHGFLLQDETTEKIEYKDGPKRRHVLSEQRSGMADALEVPLSRLEYEVSEEAYLVFRRDTAIWKTQEKIAPFVHGGNSLQERVIPVLSLEKRGAEGASTAQYEVVATALAPQGGRERLELQVRLQKQTSGVLSFAGPKKISLALRVVGQDGAPLQVIPQIVEVTPPGSLEQGAVLVPPGTEAATVVFSIEGDFEEKVRIEVYHPDGTEKVISKVVDGWFDMRLDRRLRTPKDGVSSSRVLSSRPPTPSSRAPVKPTTSPSESEAGMVHQQEAASFADWAEGIDDPKVRRVFEIIDSQGSINEQDLHMVLGNARRARIFSMAFDVLILKVPFEVQITTLGGMKVYVKGSAR